METLVDENDVILHNQTSPIDVSDGFFLADLFLKMQEIVHDKKAFGLSANQIGVNKSVFVIRVPKKEVLLFCNPDIVYYSDEMDTMEEGCLSYPNLILKVKRSKKIRVRFDTFDERTGQIIRRSETFKGMTARIFQHEFDHIKGITFVDRASFYHRELGFKKRKKLKRKTKRK